MRPAAGQEHGEIFHPGTGGKKFRLAGKLEADFVHARLVDRSGHDRIQLTGESEAGGFLKRSPGGAGAFRGRLA